MRKFTSILFGFCLVMVIGFPSFTLFAQDTATPTPAPSTNRVAILVIDVFEVIGRSEEIEEAPETNCVISPNGQDGAAWGRTSGAGPTHLTSVLHPGIDPHGRLVYSEIEALLRNQGAVLTQHTLGSDPNIFGNAVQIPNSNPTSQSPYQFTSSNPNQYWMRDVETWELGGNEILLVAIDTSEYESAAMAQRIREAVDLFQNRTESVTSFVLNMSFAIIPCSDFPKVDFSDYTTLLAQEGLATLCDSLVQQIRSSAETCVELGEEADSTAGLIQTVALSPREGLMYRVPAGVAGRQPTFGLPYSYQGEEPTPATTLFQVLSLPEFVVVRNSVYETYIVPQLSQAFAAYQVGGWQGDGLPPFIPTGSGGGGGVTPDVTFTPDFQFTPTALAFTATPQPPVPKDPFYDLFDGDGINDMCDPALICVPVASAGNDGHPYPYAPALFQNTISVSAEYSGANFCLGSSQGGGALVSNRGEIQMHGFYNCLPGTSFAAPRLSFLMALYLASGNTVSQCTGTSPTPTPSVTGVVNDSPLNSSDWMTGQWADDSIFVASDKYCEDFDNIVFAP